VVSCLYMQLPGPMEEGVSKPLFVAPKEAASILGCSTHTIHRAVAAGRLPCVRLNERVLRIPRAAIEIGPKEAER
jgi:excisionase family DNA binding protein